MDPLWLLDLAVRFARRAHLQRTPFAQKVPLVRLVRRWTWGYKQTKRACSIPTTWASSALS